LKDKNKDNKEKLTEEDLEKIFDATWKNWESRRKCEKTHTPEFVKKNKGSKNT